MYLVILNWNDFIYILNNCYILNKCFNEFFFIVFLSRFRKGQVFRIIKVSIKEFFFCEFKKIDNLDREAFFVSEYFGRIFIFGRVFIFFLLEMICFVVENWCYIQVIQFYVYNFYNYIINVIVIFDVYKKCNFLKQEYYLEIYELL